MPANGTVTRLYLCACIAILLVPMSLYFNARMSNRSHYLFVSFPKSSALAARDPPKILKAVSLSPRKGENVHKGKNETSPVKRHAPGDWHDEFHRKPEPLEGHKKPKHVFHHKSVEAHSIVPPHSHSDGVEPHMHGPRVIDVLIFGPAEIQLLILHMNTLEPVVDHFVIVESDITFQGIKKEMLFRSKVLPFLSAKLQANRIEYVELRNAFQKRHRNRAYHMERKSRNAGMAGLARLKLHDSDIVMVGDVDEIPSVDAVKHIWHTFDTEGHEASHYLMLPSYRWSLHWVRKHADWIPAEDCPLKTGKPCQAGLPGPAITTWGELLHLGDMATLHELYYERTEQSKPLYDTGWHCSSCMGFENIQNKYGAFALDDHRMSHYKRTHEILIQLLKGHHVNDNDPEAYQECHECMKSAPDFAVQNVDKFSDYEAMLSHPDNDKRVSQVAAELLYEGNHHHIITELPLSESQKKETQILWDLLEQKIGRTAARKAAESSSIMKVALHLNKSMMVASNEINDNNNNASNSSSSPPPSSSSFSAV
jgi:hypothetical protein